MTQIVRKSLGLEKRILLDHPIPKWCDWADLLQKDGISPQMRMIDGELAFPDEIPPSDWRELRVASQGAMVTIRRGEKEIILVGWNNDDPAQEKLMSGLTKALVSFGHNRSS